MNQMRGIIFLILITALLLAGCATSFPEGEMKDQPFPGGYGVGRTEAELQPLPPEITEEPLQETVSADEPEASAIPEAPDSPVLASAPRGEAPAETSVEPPAAVQETAVSESREAETDIRAAYGVEDDTGDFRAAWIGLPVLLLLLVIVLAEFVRWAVCRKPMFAWGKQTGRRETEAKAAQEPETKGRFLRRADRILDAVFSDIDDGEDGEDI